MSLRPLFDRKIQFHLLPHKFGLYKSSWRIDARTQAHMNKDVWFLPVTCACRFCSQNRSDLIKHLRMKQAFQTLAFIAHMLGVPPAPNKNELTPMDFKEAWRVKHGKSADWFDIRPILVIDEVNNSTFVRGLRLIANSAQIPVVVMGTNTKIQLLATAAAGSGTEAGEVYCVFLNVLPPADFKLPSAVPEALKPFVEHVVRAGFRIVFLFSFFARERKG